MNILLHICCGICAIPSIITLIEEGHEVTGFFYNPNIYPPEEYDRRLAVAQKVCREFNVLLEVASYEPELWRQKTTSLEKEPEGGSRCLVCFHMRLEKTYQYLMSTNRASFTTTLTASHHKSAPIINQIGQEIAVDKFLVRDFKKDSYSEKTRRLIQQWQLYSQKYCGCKYSLYQPKIQKK